MRRIPHLFSTLAARGESPASHRGRRCARMARRDEREYREYLVEEQRSQPGCSAGRMQLEFRHGLLNPRCRIGPLSERHSERDLSSRVAARMPGETPMADDKQAEFADLLRED